MYARKSFAAEDRPLHGEVSTCGSARAGQTEVVVRFYNAPNPFVPAPGSRSTPGVQGGSVERGKVKGRRGHTEVNSPAKAAHGPVDAT